MCGCVFELEQDPVDEREVVDAGVDPGRSLAVRLSQAERDQVAAVLARHFADGRLTVGEYEERVEAALAARTGHDVEPLLADLPQEPRPTARPRPARRQRPVSVPSVRLVAVAAVIALAVSTGLWALWLLWPALALTGPCGRSYARYVTYRPPRQQPVGDQRV